MVLQLFHLNSCSIESVGTQINLMRIFPKVCNQHQAHQYLGTTYSLFIKKSTSISFLLCSETFVIFLQDQYEKQNSSDYLYPRLHTGIHGYNLTFFLVIISMCCQQTTHHFSNGTTFFCIS